MIFVHVSCIWSGRAFTLYILQCLMRFPVLNQRKSPKLFTAETNSYGGESLPWMSVTPQICKNTHASHKLIRLNSMDNSSIFLDDRNRVE